MYWSRDARRKRMGQWEVEQMSIRYKSECKELPPRKATEEEKREWKKRKEIEAKKEKVIK